MLSGANRQAVLSLAHDLIRARIPRFVAYEVVCHHRATMDSLNATEVQALGDGMSDWGEIDSFGCFIAGPAWRDGRVPDRVIRNWTRSPDWCWRRAALVSTVALNCKARGGEGDAVRTLDICLRLKDDRHDMIEKALSWALRELAKRDDASVRRFLAEHGEELPARVRREVGNKLTTGLKNPRRVP